MKIRPKLNFRMLDLQGGGQKTGSSIEEVCRKMGIHQATFNNWKKKFGGQGVTELRGLRQLEDENTKLKQLVADLTLDKHMLQDVLKKRFKASPIEGGLPKL